MSGTISATFDAAAAGVRVTGTGFSPTTVREVTAVGRDGVSRVIDSWTDETVLHLLVTLPDNRQFGHTTSVAADGTLNQLVDVDGGGAGTYTVVARDHYDDSVLIATATFDVT